MVVVAPGRRAKRADWIHMLTPDGPRRRCMSSSFSRICIRARCWASRTASDSFQDDHSRAMWMFVMIAPKSPGHLLRRVYSEGRGVPSLIAIQRIRAAEAHEYALAYAHGIGSTRAGVLQTTFKEETESDLFGEQAVLCGGLTSLIKKGSRRWFEAG